MKSVVVSGFRSFDLVERPKPEVSPKRVILKTKYAAICGSDNMFWSSEDYAGMCPGHEFSGYIEDPGEFPFKKGQRVCAAEFNPCGACEFCKSGREQLCVQMMMDNPGVSMDGAFGEYVSVRPDIDSASFDIRITPSSPVPLNRNERTGSVYRLHMHGLPNRTAFSAEGTDSVQYLLRTTLTALMLPEIILLATDFFTHRILINNHAAQPEVRLRLLSIERIHGHRQVFEPISIPLVYRPLLPNVFIQIRNLPSNHSSDDITHPVVIANLLVLIPWSSLAALSRPFPNLVSVLFTIRQEQATCRTCDHLITIEADAAIIPEQAGLNRATLTKFPRQSRIRSDGIGCAKTLRSVFHNQSTMPVCYISYTILYITSS